MKKRAIFILGLFLFIVVSGLNVSAENQSLENMTETERIDLAYDCLYDTVQDRGCSRLTLEQQIFSLLSMGECYDEVMEASREGECWPRTGCDIKTTSIAVLALDNANQDVSEAKNWLSSQNTTPRDLNWYLEIESKSEVSCSIIYGNQENTINIGEDKKIDSDAGNCLALDPSGYWLKINPACYSESFKISCDKDFITTLIFKNPDSPTIYVVDETHSASAEGTTTEKIKSACFSENDRCDYESSLWATMILELIGDDVSNFVPYLLTEEEVNKEFFPEPFLYLITGFSEYKAEIASKQKTKGSWEAINGEYYSTALALYPFQGSNLDFKIKAKDWLFEIQPEEGCWDERDIKNNAFLLHSIWPKRVLISDNDQEDTNETINETINETNNETGNETDVPNYYDDDDPCEEEGYTCTRESLCSGEVLDYDCSGSLICCNSTKPVEEDTCNSYGGNVCSSDQECTGLSSDDSFKTSDLEEGEVCCLWGMCEDKTIEPGVGNEESECVTRGGICEIGETCGPGYKERTIWDCESNEVCCVEETEPGPNPEPEEEKSYWWLWALFALIILTTLGILFKDKIQEFILKIKTRGGKKGGRPHHGPPRGPPSYPRKPMRRPIPQRKIVPPPARRPMNPPQKPNKNIPPKKPLPKPNQKDNELNDVLKKLKEMGK